jgi:heat shock protein HslJ
MANTSLLLSVITLTALVACASNQAPEPPSAGSPEAGYRAAGNEPFWLLRFGETTMEFSSLSDPDTVSVTRPAAEGIADGWRFSTSSGGQPFTVRVEDRGCNDSMSGRPFPHTVEVDVNGRNYSGCGGDTASLIVGREWTVTHLEGAEITGPQRPTMLFGADGSLSGSGSCNRYAGSYQITGEGIEIGTAAATRMACLDPDVSAQETRFFALLEQVTRFDIAADGSLELLSGDQPVIVAR